MNRIYALRPNINIIKKPINWENIGLCLGNGHIKFGSEGAVLEFAKNRVMKGLTAKVPHEVFVGWKDCEVLGVWKGDRESVSLSEDLPEGTSGMHGHITDTPLSPQDYKFFMLENYKEAIALCTSGKYSKITRLNSEDANNELTEKKIMKIYKKARRLEYLLIFEFICKEIGVFFKTLGRNIMNEEFYSDFITFYYKDSAIAGQKLCAFWDRHSGEEMGAIFETDLR